MGVLAFYHLLFCLGVKPFDKFDAHIGIADQNVSKCCVAYVEQLAWRRKGKNCIPMSVVCAWSIASGE